MSEGTITAAALRARAEALITTNSAPLPDEGDDDARLIAAERRFRASKERRLAFSEEFKSDSEAERFGEAIWRSEEVLIDVMNHATPRTRAGALAKLRAILWFADLDDDPEIEEVIELLEPRDGAAATDDTTTEAERDPFAFAGDAAEGDRRESDARLLALFREWIEALRQYDANEGDVGYDDAAELEDQIYQLPACGPVGLAIKGYFVTWVARREDLRAGDPTASVGTAKPGDYFDVVDGSCSIEAMISYRGDRR